MSDEELLESIDRHFMAGCPAINTTQYRQHEKAGICPECSARALVAAGVRVTVKAKS